MSSQTYTMSSWTYILQWVQECVDSGGGDTKSTELKEHAGSRTQEYFQEGVFYVQEGVLQGVV